MEELSIIFKYDFESYPGPKENDYVRSINVKALKTNLESTDFEEIGRARFYLVYIAQARNAQEDLAEVFDEHEYTFRHAQEFYDFEGDDFREEIQKFYNYEFVAPNVCILERLEILPKYRGLQIGKSLTADILFHFEDSCSLIILQPYPLQFEVKTREKDEWRENLKLNAFEQDENKAFDKLTKYYQSWGFDNIPGIEGLLFYNPLLGNEKIATTNVSEYLNRASLQG